MNFGGLSKTFALLGACFGLFCCRNIIIFLSKILIPEATVLLLKFVDIVLCLIDFYDIVHNCATKTAPNHNWISAMFNYTNKILFFCKFTCSNFQSSDFKTFHCPILVGSLNYFRYSCLFPKIVHRVDLLRIRNVLPW